jgi:hypothetical protein
MQRFYDKWKASGEPTTKDDMWSDQQYDEWLAAPINKLVPGVSTFDNIADALIAAGYDPDIINEIIYGRWEKNEYDELVRDPNTGAKYNRSGQDSVTLEGLLSSETNYNWHILDDLAGDESEDWRVFTVDTDGDGIDDTVYREGTDGVFQRVYGAEVDESDPQIAGQIIDAARNARIYDEAINSEGWDELEDWEKNAVLRENGYDYNRNGWFGDGPDDYSEFV